MDRKIKLKVLHVRREYLFQPCLTLNNKDTVSNTTRNMIYDVINKYDSHHNQTRKLNKIRKILVLTTVFLTLCISKSLSQLLPPAVAIV